MSLRFILGFLIGFMLGASIALALAPRPDAPAASPDWMPARPGEHEG